MGPGWAPDGPSWAPLGSHLGLTGAHLVVVLVLEHIKLCAACVGIDPSEVRCHSLRRTGAAHLHCIKVPLEDIMSIGDWKSMAVLDYLVTPRACMDDI